MDTYKALHHRSVTDPIEGFSYLGTLSFTGVTVFGWALSLADLLLILSLVLSGLSFAVHLWATLRRDARETKAFELMRKSHDK